jgi:hypothetical protein
MAVGIQRSLVIGEEDDDVGSGGGCLRGAGESKCRNQEGATAMDHGGDVTVVGHLVTPFAALSFLGLRRSQWVKS